MGLAKLRTPEYRSLQNALQPLIPNGLRASVRLCGSSERKKKKNASAESWRPESGDTILISFEPIREAQVAPEIKTEHEQTGGVAPTPTSDRVRSRNPAPSTSDPCADLVRALDRAESRPGFEFVALKWFRDTALIEEGFSWAQTESARQSKLRDAIANRLILTNRVENPRSPQFPVTTIRLNRLLPEVQAILRGSGQGGEDFAPASIKGEPLSATVLRDRR